MLRYEYYSEISVCNLLITVPHTILRHLDHFRQFLADHYHDNLRSMYQCGDERLKYGLDTGGTRYR